VLWRFLPKTGLVLFNFIFIAKKKKKQEEIVHSLEDIIRSKMKIELLWKRNLKSELIDKKKL
jgi:hypothetical protein